LRVDDGIYRAKSRPLPNRHLLLQLIYDPLACLKGFGPVGTRHSQKKGCFSDEDEASSMMNDNDLQAKSLRSLFDNEFQLMLGHFGVRLVVDPYKSAAVLNWPDYTPKIDNRAGASDVARACCKRLLRYRNFTNDICHAFKLVATVTDSELASYKRRYKNEHESM
jgi:hypothetical protein